MAPGRSRRPCLGPPPLGIAERVRAGIDLAVQHQAGMATLGYEIVQRTGGRDGTASGPEVPACIAKQRETRPNITGQCQRDGASLFWAGAADPIEEDLIDANFMVDEHAETGVGVSL